MDAVQAIAEGMAYARNNPLASKEERANRASAFGLAWETETVSAHTLEYYFWKGTVKILGR